MRQRFQLCFLVLIAAALVSLNVLTWRVLHEQRVANAYLVNMSAQGVMATFHLFTMQTLMSVQAWGLTPLPDLTRPAQEN